MISVLIKTLACQMEDEDANGVEQGSSEVSQMDQGARSFPRLSRENVVVTTHGATVAVEVTHIYTKRLSGTITMMQKHHGKSV